MIVANMSQRMVRKWWRQNIPITRHSYTYAQDAIGRDFHKDI